MMALRVMAPERLTTARLILRRPLCADAEAIFTRYSADPEVTQFLGWQRHNSIDDTRRFLDFSDEEWGRWHAGPYLIEHLEGPHLLGSTGIHFATPVRAMTGYVLAKDSWGFGYATEALGAIVRLGKELKVHELRALCHPSHVASQRVLEKCGFVCQAKRIEGTPFPNLGPALCADALCYVLSVSRST
jgi:[ribosomal protein S5]-alanine N-acetyltransferase